MDDISYDDFEKEEKLTVCKIILGDQLRLYKRDVYNFMTALTDFGGFNDGVLLFPSVLMTLYSSKMFYASLFSFFPTKQDDKKLDHKKVKDACQ